MIPLKYRSDIDGLRAVAVLGVVVYHAFPWVIPGGFIGVDIFFVISGYLISGILYKGHKTGNFSFTEFYARRVRRLFPALITMLVITLAYGWLILLPDEFRKLGKHVAAGTLFIQNFVFWQESGYFDTAVSLKPLLHLWSLAVEEQFYIFFPLLLVVLWKKLRFLVPAMGLLLIVTFILNVVMSVQNSGSDFFLTPYRAWEFLGGSLLAWWHYDKEHEEEVPPYREALSWIGLILLALGFAVIHTGDPYPGWRAVLPVAGTLLLMEGGKTAWVNRKILSNPVLVWIGLISYPLYLFHWPALAFVHIVKGEYAKQEYIIGALGVSFILTVLTYYFIEKKIRHNKSKWTIPVLAGAFLIMGILSSLVWARWIPTHISPRDAAVANAIGDKNFAEGATFHFSEVNLYTIGGNGSKTLFLGDSNMQQYEPRIIKKLCGNFGNSRGAIFIGCGGVPPIPDYILFDQPKRSLMSELEKQIKEHPEIDRIVIAALWPEYFKDNKSKNKIFGIPANTSVGVQKSLDSLGRLIQKYRDMGKKITLVLSIPYGDELCPAFFFNRTFFGAFYRPPLPLKRAKFLSENGGIIDQVKSVALANGAHVIDPMDWLCDGELCRRDDAHGIPLHYDHAHLRPGYVRDQLTYLDDTVDP